MTAISPWTSFQVAYKILLKLADFFFSYWKYWLWLTAYKAYISSWKIGSKGELVTVKEFHCSLWGKEDVHHLQLAPRGCETWLSFQKLQMLQQSYMGKHLVRLVRDQGTVWTMTAIYLLIWTTIGQIHVQGAWTNMAFTKSNIYQGNGIHAGTVNQGKIAYQL